MDMKCKLLKKDFTIESGETRQYYVLQFALIDGSSLEIPVKGDKARLLVITANLENRNK